MSIREQQAAENEATARDLNEQLEEAPGDGDGPTGGRAAPIVCECADVACERVVMITAQEYAELRRDPRRFAVAHGHVLPDVERIVSDAGRFVVVAKREGTPADVAVERDPRE